MRKPKPSGQKLPTKIQSIYDSIVLPSDLTLKTEYDQSTNSFVAYYEQYPQAITVGNTKAEAEANLIPLFELMKKEKGLI